MKIALIQTYIYWEDKEKNLQHFQSIINSLNSENYSEQEIDVYVLPEMFTTGFSMNSKVYAERLGERTTQWFLELSSQKKACVTGSFMTTDGKNYYNTLIWAYPDRKYAYYHKRHLFRMAEEHKYYSPGNYKIICEYKGFKFLPLICYDLRFPVWSRNIIGTNDEYDVLLYVANWPKVRIDAWKKIIYARAIENLCYVIAVNRIGTDGTGKEYNGKSMAVNFKGELMANLEEKEQMTIVTLNKEELKSFREKFPAYLDADQFEINL